MRSEVRTPQEGHQIRLRKRQRSRQRLLMSLTVGPSRLRLQAGCSRPYPTVVLSHAGVPKPLKTYNCRPGGSTIAGGGAA